MWQKQNYKIKIVKDEIIIAVINYTISTAVGIFLTFSYLKAEV